jgi:hypothetical protein
MSTALAVKFDEPTTASNTWLHYHDLLNAPNTSISLQNTHHFVPMFYAGVNDQRRCELFSAQRRPHAGVISESLVFVPIALGSSRSRTIDKKARSDFRIAVIEGLAELLFAASNKPIVAFDALASAVSDALSFASRLPIDLPTPAWSASEDGDVALQWRTDKGRALVTFEGGGEIGYALLKNGSFHPGGAVDVTPEAPPADLLQYVRSIA